MIKYLAAILLLLIATGTRAQKPEQYIIETNGGLCSFGILLYPDGTYVYEHGCEGTSLINYGYWKQSGDTLSLQSRNNQNIDVIDTVITSGTATDSIRVRVLDKAGVDITENMTMHMLVTGKPSVPFDNSFSVPRATHKVKNGEVSLRTLARIFDREFNYAPGNAAELTIKLKIPEGWIFSEFSEWYNLTDKQYLKRNNSLEEIATYGNNRMIFERVME